MVRELVPESGARPPSSWRARELSELRRFAGILIDLCFDHFLSLHWQRFADLELPSFVNVGIANRSIGDLTLGLDLVWTEWSTYD